MLVYCVVETFDGEVMGANVFTRRDKALNHAVNIVVELESNDEEFSGPIEPLRDSALEILDSCKEYYGQDWTVNIIESEMK